MKKGKKILATVVIGAATIAVAAYLLRGARTKIDEKKLKKKRGKRSHSKK